ncbi:NAD-binding protein [Streptomyces hydrogenans]|uniref:NAD-binding protein n=1 Tax=Streptomyces hydrogenans TaxID=1873719 RepID=UPI0035D767D8
MNTTEAFRTGSANHPPAPEIVDHTVLVGLGKIGTRVLARLRTTDHKVVVIERDPAARGVAHTRELGIPLLIEDATAPGVLEQAGIRHSNSLLSSRTAMGRTSTSPWPPGRSTRRSGWSCACTTTTSPRPCPPPCVPRTPARSPVAAASPPSPHRRSPPP